MIPLSNDDTGKLLNEVAEQTNSTIVILFYLDTRTGQSMINSLGATPELNEIAKCQSTVLGMLQWPAPGDKAWKPTSVIDHSEET